MLNNRLLIIRSPLWDPCQLLIPWAVTPTKLIPFEGSDPSLPPLPPNKQPFLLPSRTGSNEYHSPALLRRQKVQMSLFLKRVGGHTNNYLCSEKMGSFNSKIILAASLLIGLFFAVMASCQCKSSQQGSSEPTCLFDSVVFS